MQSPSARHGENQIVSNFEWGGIDRNRAETFIRGTSPNDRWIVTTSRVYNSYIIVDE